MKGLECRAKGGDELDWPAGRWERAGDVPTGRAGIEAGSA